MIIKIISIVATEKKHFKNDLKNDFLILGEGANFDNNGRFGASEIKLISFLVKQRQNFA